MLNIVLAFLCVVTYRQYRYFKEQAIQLVQMQCLYQESVEKFSQYIQMQREPGKKIMVSNKPVQHEQDVGKCDSFWLLNQDMQKLQQANDNYLLSCMIDTQVQVKESRTPVTEKQNKKKSVQKVKAGAVKSKTKERVFKRYTKKQSKDMQFAWPVKRSKFWLSSFFGPRKKPDGSQGFHYGVDLAALKGTPVFAAANGVVREAGWMTGYGKTITLAHNRKYKTRYAHLNKIVVKKNQKIRTGELIGYVGATGNVRSKNGRDASHLHFEVHAYGKKINPMHYLS